MLRNSAPCNHQHFQSRWPQLLACLAAAFIDQALAGETQRSPIHLSTHHPSVNKEVALGYQALRDNSLEAARLAYEQSLLAEPHNLDALLALAALAERQGRTAMAASYRQRAFSADPLDANVQAALFGRADSDQISAESRLKAALSQHPNAAALNFALGNLYARQKRWAEAQQVYFHAVAAHGESPDYLANLAISLDQLQQIPLAAQYYRQALEAAQKYPAAFAASRLEQRLRELTP